MSNNQEKNQGWFGNHQEMLSGTYLMMRSDDLDWKELERKLSSEGFAGIKNSFVDILIEFSPYETDNYFVENNEKVRLVELDPETHFYGPISMLDFVNAPGLSLESKAHSFILDAKESWNEGTC